MLSRPAAAECGSRESVQCEASVLLADPSLQRGKGGGGVAAHLGAKQPQQRGGPALNVSSFHHPDAPRGCLLEQVLEGDSAQRHRAFAYPPPPRIDSGNGERPAEVAALPGPAAGTRLERAVQLRDLLVDIPLGPARHVGPHLPDRVRIGLEHRLAFEQVHNRSPKEPGRDRTKPAPVPAIPCRILHAVRTATAAMISPTDTAEQPDVAFRRPLTALAARQSTGEVVAARRAS